MAKFAHETTLKAFEECNREKDVASFIQLEFNKAHGYVPLLSLDFPFDVAPLAFSLYPSQMPCIVPSESRAARNPCGVLQSDARLVHRCVLVLSSWMFFSVARTLNTIPCLLILLLHRAVCARLPTNRSATAIFKSEH
jgi:hypothetical protein